MLEVKMSELVMPDVERRRPSRPRRASVVNKLTREIHCMSMPDVINVV